MLPRLQAEQQLRGIEAALVPHLKPEAANRTIERHKKELRPPQERKPKGMAAQLLDAFHASGLPVVQEPVPKPSRERGDKPGRDER